MREALCVAFICFGCAHSPTKPTESADPFAGKARGTVRSLVLDERATDTEAKTPATPRTPSTEQIVDHVTK